MGEYAFAGPSFKNAVDKLFNTRPQSVEKILVARPLCIDLLAFAVNLLNGIGSVCSVQNTAARNLPVDQQRDIGIIFLLQRGGNALSGHDLPSDVLMKYCEIGNNIEVAI